MECVITDLNSICKGCGFFNSETNANNGFACSHPNCGDWTSIDRDGYTLDLSPSKIERLIAMSFSKRNIKCNRRLAKKYLKKARKSNWRKELERIGVKTIGLCYSFTCPIAWTIEFEDINNYLNANEYDYIDGNKDMPSGFGDDLMGIEKAQADKLLIEY